MVTLLSVKEKFLEIIKIFFSSVSQLIYLKSKEEKTAQVETFSVKKLRKEICVLTNKCSAYVVML